jgi:hypothetical protein
MKAMQPSRTYGLVLETNSRQSVCHARVASQTYLQQDTALPTTASTFTKIRINNTGQRGFGYVTAAQDPRIIQVALTLLS